MWERGEKRGMGGDEREREGERGREEIEMQKHSLKSVLAIANQSSQH